MITSSSCSRVKNPRSSTGDISPKSGANAFPSFATSLASSSQGSDKEAPGIRPILRLTRFNLPRLWSGCMAQHSPSYSSRRGAMYSQAILMVSCVTQAGCGRHWKDSPANWMTLEYEAWYGLRIQMMHTSEGDIVVPRRGTYLATTRQ